MNRIKSFFYNNIALVGLLIVLFVGICVQRTFVSTENLCNLLRSASLMGFIGIGMTFVVLCGSIDLSVASVFALAGYLMMNLSQYNLVLALVIPLLAGAVVGFINGILVEKLSIPAFIATLATQMFIRGLVQMLCNQETYKVESVPMPILALGAIADALFLGFMSMLTSALTGNTVIGYMPPLLYYALNIGMGPKLGSFYLFSMIKGSYTAKLWLFVVGILMIAAALFYQRLRKRMA